MRMGSYFFWWFVDKLLKIINILLLCKSGSVSRFYFADGINSSISFSNIKWFLCEGGFDIAYPCCVIYSDI